MTLNPTRPIRIAGDRAGTAAVEFALIMPLFVTLFFGTFEVANLLLADMKLTATAQAAADVLARPLIGEASERLRPRRRNQCGIASHDAAADHDPAQDRLCRRDI